MTGAIRRLVAGSGRRLAASLIALVAAIATLVVPATAANASTLPSAMTIVAHVCNDIGNHGAEHAVLCSDLGRETISGGHRYYMITEAICQTSAGYVQCLDNDVFNGLYVSGMTGAPQWEFRCGPTTGACITPREYWYNTHIDLPTGVCVEVWGVTWGDAADGWQSSIDISGGRLKLSGNQETGHYSACG